MNTELSHNRRILIVDDNPSIHEDYRKTLTQHRPADDLSDLSAALFGEAITQSTQVEYQFDSAFQGQEALEKVRQSIKQNAPYAMAFVDMRMPPGWDGVETIQQLWHADPSLEVVICTAYSDLSWHGIVEKLGTTDRLLILKKPFDSAEVSQLALALTQKWNLARQAHMKIIEMERMVEQRTVQLQKMNARLEMEMTQRAAAEDRLRHDAFHDVLTNLPNRALLLERLGNCIERSKRQEGYHYAVLFIDLDGFKSINDTLGHEAGDELLIGMAERLRMTVRGLDAVSRPAGDTTARLGGDEFVVLLDGMDAPDTAEVVAQRIRARLTEPFDIAGREVAVGASVGIADGQPEYEQPEDVLRDADTALYRAKEDGKGTVVRFDRAMLDGVAARLQLENALRKALEYQQIGVQYQPIVDISTAQIVGFEALMRWRHPTLGDVPPSKFIPVAEEVGLITQLGQWVLSKACRQCQAWRSRFPQHESLRISVNLSRRQVKEPELLDTLDAVLAESSLPPENLIVEVTESLVMNKPQLTREVLAKVKARRISVYMDDFGTGYSSLSCLHSLPLDAVKIDRAFIRDMKLDGEHASTVQAIVTLAHQRGFQVIAEGIETEGQLAQLQALECDRGQGYYFAKPLDEQDAERLLITGGQWRAKVA